MKKIKRQVFFLFLSLSLLTFAFPQTQFIQEVKAEEYKFGKETIGTIISVFDPNQIWGTYFTCLYSGTAKSITMYFKQESSGVYPKIKYAIYKRANYSLIGYTEEWTITEGWNDWKALNITLGGNLIGGTEYYLVFWSNGFIETKEDLVLNVAVTEQSLFYNNFPNTLPFPFTASDEISIYCTYTSISEENMEQYFLLGAVIPFTIGLGLIIIAQKKRNKNYP